MSSPTFKQLVEPECGQSNPLVDLANKIFIPEPLSSRNERCRSLLSNKCSRENDFVFEYLSKHKKKIAPRTFDMHSLLKDLTKANDWTTEFFQTKYSQEKLTTSRDNELSSRWNALAIDGIVQDRHLDNLKWSIEYLQDVDGVLDSQHLRTDAVENDAEWADEYEDFILSLNRKEHGDDLITSSYTTSVSTQSDLHNVWNSERVNDWIDEYTKNLSVRMNDYYDKYEFHEENPYSSVTDPLVAGKKCHASGDLSNAILYFEAAVRQQQDNAEAWQYLGQAQAENEHEIKTIAALKKCLDLDPNNLSAMLTLATAYTNESMFSSGCQILMNWMKANPKCEKFVHNLRNSDQPNNSTFLDRQLFKDVESAFLQAANECLENVDADIQNAMGILYHMSGDLDKAADCFRTALTVRPEDARLWNRLGATLANSQKSAEAVQAYRQALELYPAFVRARYNLGVSCLNLGSHEQAVEHFVAALSLQQNGIGPSGDVGDISNTIWNTLRVATASLNRHDKSHLLKSIDDRNFQALKAHVHNS